MKASVDMLSIRDAVAQYVEEAIFDLRQHSLSQAEKKHLAFLAEISYLKGVTDELQRQAQQHNKE